ncbi:unnamed protein product [Hyaloperonospora brassicae]|uniref:WRKY19-like zinc finger domain-containing protein n=1 Tax=Hyaloperonospora brassicae TaxID=162125 RepID=A0AAV0TUZ7_HYABA|nr:unnamed protein product [Hyaloperonospora brassicae]
MCRPIESCNALGVTGAAAVAMLAEYQLAAVNNMASGKPTATFVDRTAAWPSARDTGITGANGMAILSTAAPPLAFPFVSFPKHSGLPTMPWGATVPAEVDLLHVDVPTSHFETTSVPSEVPVTSTMHTQPSSYKAQELKELLEFPMPSDLADGRHDKLDVDPLDGGFTGTEMSILYSVLADAPEDESERAATVHRGIPDLTTVLMRSSVEGLREPSLESDVTDSEVQRSPCGSEPQRRASEDIKSPEGVKSRRLCKREGCYKRSRSNRLCISHGGGRRCIVEGCDKCSQGGNLCIRHGGGKRCSHDNCDKAAQSNFLCKAHGGGPRCRFTGCTRSSQGGGFCRSHGGGKRCVLEGCKKGTQRGDYCSLHGGSRVCEVPGCRRNDRGGGLCATHGGGKRCTVAGCSKPCRRNGMCSAHLRRAGDAKE